MMTQPLNDRVPITNPDGTPTQYFIRQLQERGIAVDDKISLEEALDLINDALGSHTVNAGTGLSGGGTLASNPTLSLNAFLDDLNDVDFSTPPTDGQVMVYDQGLGLWLPGDQTGGGGGGGGGGAWSLIDSWDFAVSGAITERIVDISGYTDVLIIFDSVTTSSSTWRVAQFSLDGGATYISSTVYRSLSSTGTATNTDSALFTHATASAAARSTVAYIKGTNVDGAPKEYETARDSGVGVFGDSATATLGAITHVRLFPRDGGTITFNGGRIYVIGRPKGSGGGGGQPWWFNPPKATDFTQDTGAAHGFASLTDDPDVGLVFDFGTPVSGDDSIWAYQAIPNPSADWTATMKFHTLLPRQNYSAMGIMCQYSGNSRILANYVADSNNMKFLRLNPGSFNSETAITLSVINPVNWLRLKRVGANISAQISPDGKSWVEWATTTIADWLTTEPDRIGFGVLYNRATGINVVGSIPHWDFQ
jgi:hypothetical protein